MFDIISPRYDFLNHLLSFNTDVLWRRRAAELCAAAGFKPRRMLDICAGTGDLGLQLQRRWGCDVVVTDFAGRMLDIGATKARRKRIRSAQFLRADALKLPFREAAFDACAVAFGLRNVADPETAVREMARVVRPGGRVVVLEFTLPLRPWVRNGYLFYFNRILPLLGEMLAPSRRGAYRYLPLSVASWTPPQRLLEIMRSSGLTRVSFQPLSLGVAGIHVGTRPESSELMARSPGPNPPFLASSPKLPAPSSQPNRQNDAAP
ncbi:MAG: ubiquinone/menaquinone biosynthesis methyltransferase [Planctomycetes bacterium]|nr:ubiquinone/menaquinone biosynthesis methyltransferase [Planctomycetota bacterium]